MIAQLPAIYLGSASPRRQELLRKIGVDFIVVEPNVVEEKLTDENPSEMVERLAILKAENVLQKINQQPPRPVLSADTIVVIDDKVLGKPKNEEDALLMLSLLSNRTHEVLTAVALIDPHQVAIRLSKSEVTFSTITPEQAKKYWVTGEPQDKAGAYAIQGMASIFIKNINGSYSGIMGMPLYETYSLLSRLRK
ncbi:MAG: Maf family nucleotide pyrophosphatase [Gammaproteobacteria bacterium]|nr:Maf family nucleotide pyrophosphatase [Gammaproteobacteria bacterium]